MHTQSNPPTLARWPLWTADVLESHIFKPTLQVALLQETKNNVILQMNQASNAYFILYSKLFIREEKTDSGNSTHTAFQNKEYTFQPFYLWTIVWKPFILYYCKCYCCNCCHNNDDPRTVGIAAVSLEWHALFSVYSVYISVPSFPVCSYFP